MSDYKKKAIIFSAPSGAGKTTILKELLKKDELRLEFSISAASRNPREGEINGKDYYFINQESFKQKIDNCEFIEWEEVFAGSLYGTYKKELERIWNKGCSVAFDIDVKGGLNMKKILGDSAISIFIMPPSLEELEKRLKNRGTENEESIQKRLSRAEYEIGLSKTFDKIVINDTINETINETYKIISDFINDNK